MTLIDNNKFNEIFDKLSKEFKEDTHHRLLSWNHLNEHWQEYANGNIKDINQVALNLSYYLASYGMYRGKSDLLQRDYKAIIPAIEFLRIQQKNDWRDIIFLDKKPEDIALRIRTLALDLRTALIPNLVRPGKVISQVKVTDTLLSKILLGTFDCVPAFDLQAKNALKDILKNDYPKGDGFSQHRMTEMIKFARDNRSLIESGKELIKKENGVNYSLTRIFDLYLWYHGAILTKKN